MSRTLRLFLLALLVCSASRNAEAQWDLFWQHADGWRAVWTMDGTTRLTGELLPTGLFPDIPAPDPLWQIEQADSFSMLLRHQGDGRLAGWWMSCGYPSGTFELPQVPDLNWKVRGWGSFNDLPFFYLIWQNEATGEIAAWKMGTDSTTRLDARLLTPSVPDTNWRIVGVADFNSDGNSDLLWQHQTSGLIGLWYMNGLTRTEGVLLGQVPDTDWKIRGVTQVNWSDPDGRFHPDLIWQHQTTGLIAVWLMKGRQQVAGMLLSPPADRVLDTNWRIVGGGYRDWGCGIF
jgi:hypothetical protein